MTPEKGCRACRQEKLPDSVAQEQAADGAGMGQENISENGNNGLQNIPAQEDTQKEMQNGKILHLHERLSPGSERYLTETPALGRPDLVPSSDNNVKVTVPVDGSGVSTGKVTENEANFKSQALVKMKKCAFALVFIYS